MQKKILVLASNNDHKIKEFKEMFPEYDVKALEDIGFFEDIVEDGTTFFENSLIKAKAVYKFLKEKGESATIIADDSGLCVDALGGAPGIYSARYAQDHDKQANRDKLLADLKGVKDRSAHFLCCIVKMNEDGSYKHYEGKTFGKITEREIGDTGFTYDCLFYCPELGKTFGEATLDEKQKVSHRGRAVELLKKDLQQREIV